PCPQSQAGQQARSRLPSRRQSHSTDRRSPCRLTFPRPLLNSFCRRFSELESSQRRLRAALCTPAPSCDRRGRRLSRAPPSQPSHRLDGGPVSYFRKPLGGCGLLAGFVSYFDSRVMSGPPRGRKSASSASAASLPSTSLPSTYTVNDLRYFSRFSGSAIVAFVHS